MCRQGAPAAIDAGLPEPGIDDREAEAKATAQPHVDMKMCPVPSMRTPQRPISRRRYVVPFTHHERLLAKDQEVPRVDGRELLAPPTAAQARGAQPSGLQQRCETLIVV